MKPLLSFLILLLSVGTAGCGDKRAPDPMPEPKPTTPGFEVCKASDADWVRSTYLGVLGSRPQSQAEVRIYVDLLRQARLSAGAQSADVGEGATEAAARELVVRAMARTPGFVDRWSEHFMDALRIARFEVQSQQTCYGFTARGRDRGELASWVRDHASDEPPGSGDGKGGFTMLDLLHSSLELDDVSPLYRGHLYALVNRPIPAANVDRVEAELARRDDFGQQFDSAYLHRDIVCLGCHNSRESVTFHPSPARNRHWPVEGDFETALYGQPTGIDPVRAHAPLRFDGVVADLFLEQSGDAMPWGWSPQCGTFMRAQESQDPAAIDGYFGNLRGKNLSVYDLDESLRRGFELIKKNGLPLGEGGAVLDADAAFAYLVAANIVEGVWIEVIGSSLTITNYFPRNQASRDVLQGLTRDFIASGFSVQKLLADIVNTPYFARLSPSAGCGDAPYNMPPVYDPWTIADDDAERRQNSAGDGVAALSARTLLRSAYQSLEWELPYFTSFPELPFEIEYCQAKFNCEEMKTHCDTEKECCLAYEYRCSNPPGPKQPVPAELRRFQRGVGVFLRNGEPGFRGLDFQARLVFEDTFGACENPGNNVDFVGKLSAEAVAASAPLREVVLALKDRLVGEARLDDSREVAVMQRLFGMPLDKPATDVADLEKKVRTLCGIMLSTPQFVLSGPGQNAELGPNPMLTPLEQRYENLCTQLSQRGFGDPNRAVQCTVNGLIIVPAGS